jgi:D-threo-aldose 1-dehydrogenase
LSNKFLSDKLHENCESGQKTAIGYREETIVTIKVSVRRKVGETLLELPVFGYGSAHLGELYDLVDEADSRATLDAAWDAGVRYYDTAPWYGRGLSEHRLGGFLRTKPRSEFQITTKVGRTLQRPKNLKTFSRAPWKGGLNFEVNFDYTYDGVMRSYEQALQRLALDSVDALVIHDLDDLFLGDRLAGHEKQLFDSGIRALEELKASGEVKAYGMGINKDETLQTTATRVDIDFALVAMPYTLLDQASLHTGMAACVKRGVSVIIGAPFASGILVTGSQAGAKYAYGAASTEIQAKVRGIEAVCQAHGVALPAAALQFPLAHPAVVSIIPGAARPSEVKQNIASLAVAIPAAFWSDLKDRNLIDKNSPAPFGA